MSETGASVGNLNSGVRLCLDFSNTLDWRTGDHVQETLTSYSDLVDWSRKAGIVTAREASQLLRDAARNPKEASKVLEQAILLREALYRIFSELAAHRRPKKNDLDILNDALAEAMSRSRVVPAGERFAWDWAGRDSALDRMLWPIARSAAELLTSGELEKVRECAGEGCGWLFLDVSRNQLRRWCDMKSCGNRAKARRYYERNRAAR